MLLQFNGTRRVSCLFAPIIFIWLAYNFGISVYNMTVYGTDIWRSMSPYYAINYLVQGGPVAWKTLSGKATCNNSAVP